jgi:hypothetical protein
MQNVRTGLQELPTGALKVDQAGGQGAFNKRWATEIASRWRDEAYGVLLVSYRDGDYWVIDGQHRLAAARLVGLDRVPTLRCFVLQNRNIQEEAQDWLDANVQRRAKSGWDRFQQRVRAGDPLAVVVAEIVAAKGVRLINSFHGQGVGTTRAVGTLLQIAAQSTHLLEQTIDVALEAWPQSRGGRSHAALGGFILSAVADFIWTYRGHPAYRRDRLVSALSKSPALAVEQSVKGVQLNPRDARGKRAAVLGYYNVGLSVNRLPEATQGDLRRLSLGQNPWMAPA